MSPEGQPVVLQSAREASRSEGSSGATGVAVARLVAMAIEAKIWIKCMVNVNIS
jgi:hypothetical protein